MHDCVTFISLWLVNKLDFQSMNAIFVGVVFIVKLNKLIHSGKIDLVTLPHVKYILLIILIRKL